MSIDSTTEQTEKLPDQLKKNHAVLTGRQLFFKATLLSIVLASIMLLVTAIGIGVYAYRQASLFSQNTNTSLSTWYETIKTGIATPPVQSQGYKNILVLGIDTVANKPDAPELTDTILLASINLNSGEVQTLSLPRDLWSSDYQTRINALYQYGKDRYPESPEDFPTEVVSDLTGIQIHHTITLTLTQLGELIDLVGGIEVDVPHAFTDTEFPREDVDIASASSDELYETISFDEGLQTMDSDTALKYIRSRKSPDLTEGTDIARSQRQQTIILALIKKLQSNAVLYNPDTLAQLYTFYINNFSEQIDLIELISTGYALYPFIENISFSGNSLSVYPDDPNGVITNPPLYKYDGQWVYEIVDSESFSIEVQNKLGALE